MGEEARVLAEAVRRACLEAATAAYEQAGISGLCGEGRWEMAVRALKELDLDAITETVSLRNGTERTR